MYLRLKVFDRLKLISRILERRTRRVAHAETLIYTVHGVARKMRREFGSVLIVIGR